MSQQTISDLITPEFTHQAETTSEQTGLMSWFRNRWNGFIDALTRGYEPQIRQKRTATGDIFYQAYDPYSKRSAYLTSDHDLRSWLEQLPYQ
jgi:hypothetical protein